MTTETAWPATRWGLSAPESYVILNGPSASGSQAFKLGLMELVARGVWVLETVERRVLLSKKHVALLRGGPRERMPSEQPLAAIWHLYQALTPHGEPGVPVEKLARAAARQYQPLGRYVRSEVLPALIERGLYQARQDRVLWVIPRTQYELTPEGESAHAELQRWLDVGATRFAGWAGSDPTQALAYAGMAGAALLLMPPLFPDLRRLRDHTRTGDADSAYYAGTTTPFYPGDDDDRAEHDPGDLDPGGLDLGGLDLPSFDLGSIDFGSLDFSSFDALDSAMSAIDSAVDSGGGGDSGSGGDGGGGGDSGGGGGDSGGGGGGES